MDAIEAASQITDLLSASLKLLDKASSRFKVLASQTDEVSQDWITNFVENASTALQVPACFLLQDWENDSKSIDDAAQWRAASTAYLELLEDSLRYTHSLQPDQATKLFIALNRFNGEADDDEWITPLAHDLASKCTSKLLTLLSSETTSKTLIQRILDTYLRSCFAKNQHPFVNPETGRKLPRALGGPQASNSIDGLGGTRWKGEGYVEALGCWNVLFECIDALQSKEMEECWYLIVPPLFTLVDDHDVLFRVRGLRSMGCLIEKTDASFIKRTSLHLLLQKSLTTSLTYLSSTNYGSLVSRALSVSLQLIDHIYPPSTSNNQISEDRFNALSQLIKEGPCNIWMFAPEKIVFATLAAQAVTSISNRMGLGILRFYKDLMHPLLNTLKMPLPMESKEVVMLYVETARAVRGLVRVGRPCVKRWRGLVLASVARCWLSLGQQLDLSSLRVELKGIVKELRVALGTIVEEDIEKMKALNDKDLNKLFV